MTHGDGATLAVSMMAIGTLLFFLGYFCLNDNIPTCLGRHYSNRQSKLHKLATLVFAVYASVFIGVAMVLCGVTFDIPPQLKIIIIDIDGVLTHDKADHKLDGTSLLYDPKCVNRLNRLISAREAKLVVCSQWGIGQTVESMQKMLTDMGVVGEVIELVPNLSNDCYTRYDKIAAWLENYPNKGIIEGLVLIDDNSSTRHLYRKVNTSRKRGGMLEKHLSGALEAIDLDIPIYIKERVQICESKIKEEMNFGGSYIPKKQYPGLKPH